MLLSMVVSPYNKICGVHDDSNPFFGIRIQLCFVDLAKLLRREISPTQEFRRRPHLRAHLIPRVDPLVSLFTRLATQRRAFYLLLLKAD